MSGSRSSCSKPLANPHSLDGTPAPTYLVGASILLAYFTAAANPSRAAAKRGPIVSDDTLTDYQINQLFDSLAKLENRMSKGFEDLHDLIDERLKGRDERIDQANNRMDGLEERVRQEEIATSRQQAYNRVMATGGGIVFGLAATTLWRVLTG